MASTSVAKSKTGTKVTPESFVEVLETDEAAGEVTVRLFGEETFKLSTDINGWLQVLAGSGRPRDVVNFVESMIVVEAEEGEKIETARWREGERFNKLVSKQKHFGLEDTFKLINDLTEAAGNDQSES